ncbi:MAG: hypothetical protein GY906_34620 [bacterium]|nr:hypothetical protein [bacterium]
MNGRWIFSTIAACSVMVSLVAAEEPVADLGIDSNVLPVTVEGVTDLEGELFRDGRILMGAQPSEEALADLAQLGVKVIVSMRTPSEMENREKVSFDEAAVVSELGMAYESIPLGGKDYPYTPEAVDRLEEILLANTGPVYLHCAMGGRGAYVWLAYLVLRHGYGLDEAMARGEAMMIKPHVMGRLLGRQTELVFAD